jgi:UDP-N-acetylmuramate: L-alanyl-gamma-D-glutamyl-meso-diaminopimelate ligase
MNMHFIAIGGSAMHNLALAMHENGHHVTGSDDEIFEPSRTRLAAKGLMPATLGWDAARITPEIDAIILGMHAREDNPELIRARGLNLKIYSYPEFLYEQSKNKTRVVIAGSHGKTTITSMVLHVLGYHGITVDFMVGAQLAGFDTMVRITDDAEFMLLEGDEYLASPIDRRPKFHLYKPNIALLSGIAWDHINVFPTFEDYLEQFRIFVNMIEPGGAIVYSAEDPEVKKVVEEARNTIKKFAYYTPTYRIEKGVCLLETPDGELPLEIFGGHNLQNLEGARWICQEMGLQEEAFYEAIASFKGASKRLEKIAESADRVVYKDFAHAPSKVAATVKAVKEQFTDRQVVACLELHTFSSLNPAFLPQYAGSMSPADKALVYFSPKAVAHKKLPALSAADVHRHFADDRITVSTETAKVVNWLKSVEGPAVFLIMTSGNFDGQNLEELAKELTTR